MINFRSISSHDLPPTPPQKLPHAGSVRTKTAAVEQTFNEHPLMRSIPHRSLIARILPVNITETVSTAQMSGKAKMDALMLFLGRCVVANAFSQRVYLFLDDLHSFDRTSLHLLHSLLKRENENIIACASVLAREEGATRIQEVVEISKISQTLKALSRTDCKKVLALSSHVNDVEQSIVDFVYERSEGIPFNIVHVERSLREAGITSLRDGKITLGAHATVEGLMALELPTSIKDLVKNRINSLTPDAQAVVFLASAIGSHFSMDLLTETLANAVSCVGCVCWSGGQGVSEIHTSPSLLLLALLHTLCFTHREEASTSGPRGFCSRSFSRSSRLRASWTLSGRRERWSSSALSRTRGASACTAC